VICESEIHFRLRIDSQRNNCERLRLRPRARVTTPTSIRLGVVGCHPSNLIVTSSSIASSDKFKERSWFSILDTDVNFVLIGSVIGCHARARRVYYTRGDHFNGEIDFLIGCDVKFDSGLVQESNCEQHNAHVPMDIN
jgi:hypothetical protein